MRKYVAVGFILFAGTLAAQTSKDTLVQEEIRRKMDQAVFEKWAAEGGPNSAGDAVARRQDQLRLEQFYNKARRFVILWESFATELNGGKTVNVKLAKQVSKAFHDLEKSEGWPAGRGKE